MDHAALAAADLAEAECYELTVGRGAILISDGRAWISEQMIIELFLSLPAAAKEQIVPVLAVLQQYYVP